MSNLVKQGKEAELGRERSWTLVHSSRGLSQSPRELGSDTSLLETSQIESRSQAFVLLHELVMNTQLSLKRELNKLRM